MSGRLAFLAEEAGATDVTLFDAMEPTDEFQAEHERRESRVRFVRGDLYAPETPEQVGPHDVVWCTGLMYHAPSPLLAMERLGAMTAELLLVGTKVIPELPGLRQTAVFYPWLERRDRDIHGHFGGRGVREPFDTDVERSYASWWWGLTPSALRAMFGWFDVVETASYPLGAQQDHYVIVARRRDAG